MSALGPDASAQLDALATNLHHWELLAGLHGEGEGEDPYYDLQAFLAAPPTLDPPEEAALAFVGGVEGKAVLHLQCHLGLDGIRMAKRGAQVTGVDFSPTALAKAAAFAQAAGAEVAWVQADATQLPEALHGRFDLVYASIGAICWIRDLGAWMASVAQALKPGGQLVLVELHPIACMPGSLAPLRLDFPYHFDGPHAYTSAGSYARPEAEAVSTSVNYAHGLGECVMAAMGVGLRLRLLQEHLEGVHSFGGCAKQEEDGLYRLRLGEREGCFPVPLLFTLVAQKA